MANLAEVTQELDDLKAKFDAIQEEHLPVEQVTEELNDLKAKFDALQEEHAEHARVN